VPEEPKSPFWMRRRTDLPATSHFLVALQPHSFAAFEPVK
jgi:hypothetical protein